MDDFFTWAAGYTVALGFEDWRPIAQWKTNFPIGRMIDPGYCWIFGAAYQANISATEGGPVFTDITDIYTSTVAELQNNPQALETECASQAMADTLDGIIQGEMPGYSASATGYPSNMQPALAIAVDMQTNEANIEDAQRAWQVFEGRTIKPSGDSSYSEDPQYAIVPRENLD